MVGISPKLGEKLPKYREINQILKKQIHEGRFRSGSRIPGEVELASEYKVSRDTARQALAMLEKDGYIHRRAGQGTFVRPLNDEGNPLLKLEHLCFLFIDVSPQIDYNLTEVTAAERWLAEHNISLSIATLKSKDLILGKFPSILQKEIVQGLLIDGAVEEFHLEIPKKFNLPFLVVGNHDLDRSYPQVRHSFDKMTDRAVNYLQAINPDKPILLIVEPFNLYGTKEMFRGYCQGIKKIGLNGPILHICENDDGYTTFRDAIKHGKYKEFSVITTDRILSSILQIYVEYKFSTKKNPIVVIGNPNRLTNWGKDLVHLMPVRADEIAIEAAKQFKLMHESGSKNVYIEFESEIIPPLETPSFDTTK